MYDNDNEETMAKAAHAMYEGAAAKNQGKSFGIPQSRSEGNIQYSHRRSYSYDDAEDAYEMGGFPYIRFADENDLPLSDCGQGAYRAPSPVKTLDDIKEEEPVEEEVKEDVPPRRAQSPIKQLFGEKGWLGRSTSMKELPSEEYRKTGIKHWGGRIKEKMLGKVRYSRPRTNSTMT